MQPLLQPHPHEFDEPNSINASNNNIVVLFAKSTLFELAITPSIINNKNSSDKLFIKPPFDYKNNFST